MMAFFWQHFNYGRGAHQFYRARAQRNGSRLKADLQFYASVFRHALSRPLSRKSFRMAGLMGMCQAANLTGFFWQAAYPLSPFPPSSKSIRHERLAQTEDHSREARSSEGPRK